MSIVTVRWAHVTHMYTHNKSHLECPEGIVLTGQDWTEGEVRFRGQAQNVVDLV